MDRYISTQYGRCYASFEGLVDALKYHSRDDEARFDPALREAQEQLIKYRVWAGKEERR